MMPRVDTIEKGAARVKEINKQVAEMDTAGEETHGVVLRLVEHASFCRKLEEVGRTFFLLCCVEIKYVASGVCAVTDHGKASKCRSWTDFAPVVKDVYCKFGYRARWVNFHEYLHFIVNNCITSKPG